MNSEELFKVDAINDMIKKLGSSELSNNVSDGYHTFGELYDHRCLLFILLAKMISINSPSIYIWKSYKHFDGSKDPDFFLLGINEMKGNQISYHIPIKFDFLTDFAKLRDKAPEWDGATPTDTIIRLLSLYTDDESIDKVHELISKKGDR